MQDEAVIVGLQESAKDLHRHPLTNTHHHFYLRGRPDGALALVRISKNASTETKRRLGCSAWHSFDEFTGPVVAFLREPVARFLSSIPETALRMTDFVNAESNRLDRVEIPGDTFAELLASANRPIADVVNLWLELVDYGFFDAHHEPQTAFLMDRWMNLAIDPRLYLVEDIETAMQQIEARTGVRALGGANRGNRGGAKPIAARSASVDLMRRITRSGVYRTLAHSGFLGQRYRKSTGPIRLTDLNALANRFSDEIKAYEPSAIETSRIQMIYRSDQLLWARVKEQGGDVAASSIWPEIRSSMTDEAARV